MSVSYTNYGEGKHQHPDSSSSYDQGYNSQPRFYTHSVTSDGFSDISFDPYSNKQYQNQYYGYSNPQFTPDEGKRQVLDVQRMPLNDSRPRLRDNSVDSDVFSSQKAPSIISSVGRDADVESIASHHTHSTTMSFATESSVSGYDQYRYHGELYRPVAAPRKVNSEVKRLFGEIHPRMLRPEEKPIVESGEETEDSMSIASSIIPRPAPRASMRLNRNRSVEFIEDEAIRLENARLKSILRASSSLPARLDRNGSKMVVRFEHVDKYANSKPRRDITDYSDIDSDHGGKSKKSKKTDVWSHVAPVGPKPARNARSNSQRSSGSSRRSSSADRSRKQSRSGSGRRSSSASSISRRSQNSSSIKQKSQNGRSPSEDVSSKGDGQVSIKMPESDRSKHSSMIGEIRSSNRGRSICSDSQKALKWSLIIGVPAVLLIVVIVVIAVLFSNQ